jgi:hypothetical protein
MIRMLIRNTEHESAALSHRRDLAHEINSRRLKAKRAAKIIRGIPFRVAPPADPAASNKT